MKVSDDICSHKIFTSYLAWLIPDMTRNAALHGVTPRSVVLTCHAHVRRKQLYNIYPTYILLYLPTVLRSVSSPL